MATKLPLEQENNSCITLLFAPCNGHLAGPLLPLLIASGHLEWVARSTSSLRHCTVEYFESNLLLVDESCLKEARMQEFTTSVVQCPHTKLVLLTTQPIEIEEMSQMVRLGGWGCLALDSPPEAYVQAITAVVQDDLWFPRNVLSHVARFNFRAKPSVMPGQRLQQASSNESIENLTVRERAVIEQIHQGCSNKEIARTLGISEETVKRHLSNMFQKLGVRRRTQLFQAVSA